MGDKSFQKSLFSQFTEIQNIDCQIQKITKNSSEDESLIMKEIVDIPAENLNTISTYEIKELKKQKKFVKLTIVTILKNVVSLYFFYNNKVYGLFILKDDNWLNKAMIFAVLFQFLGFLFGRMALNSLKLTNMFLVMIFLNILFAMTATYKMDSFNYFAALLCLN